MALKNGLTKEDYEKLSDELKAHYKEVGGVYNVDLEGGEDHEKLKALAEEQAAKAKTAQKELDDAKKELEKHKKEQEEASKSKGSELEHMNAVVEQLRKDLEEQTMKLKLADLAALKARVCETVGLTKELAERLRGETEEELTVDAKALKALVPDKPSSIGADFRPVEPTSAELAGFEAGKKLAEEYTKGLV